MPDSRLDRLAEDVIARGGVPDDSIRAMVDRPPDPDALTTVVRDLVTRGIGPQARYGLAALSLVLVPTDHRFRRAAELALHDAGLGDRYPTGLYTATARYRADDLRWWYSVFVRDVHNDDTHALILEEIGVSLVAHCRDEVVHYLLVPPRGPGSAMCESFTWALLRLRDDDGLERRWGEWIHSGGFDPGVPNAETCSALVARLQRLIDGAVPAGLRLLDQAAQRWRAMVTGPGPVDRRRVVRTLHDLVNYPSPPWSAALDAARIEVVPAAERAGIPEAAALRDALDETLWTLSRGPGLLEQPGPAVDRLRQQMLVSEGLTPDLPWNEFGRPHR